jgi:hypothetical protein
MAEVIAEESIDRSLANNPRQQKLAGVLTFSNAGVSLS